MGRPIATTLRTGKQMKAIVEANPFANVATTPSNLCVTFLSTAPTKPEVAPLHGQDWLPERFKVAGKEIYTWHPRGQGQSPPHDPGGSPSATTLRRPIVLSVTVAPESGCVTPCCQDEVRCL
ncbi:MAG: DUF1697 domain-containing protein [Myxococcota bacterium]|nr:DUF1697 domain-containing protein [Myxococcota bacterium]